MKKLFKFIIGIVGFVIAVAIILLIIVGVLLFDNKNNGEKINATTEDVVSSLNYNALDSTKENDELSYTFDVLTLNSLLGTISSNIKLDPVQITNMYTTFNNLEDDDEENDTITLYIPLKLFFYETCLISTMNIVENEDTFTLVISQAKVGRVDSNFFLIKETLDKAFKPSLVEDQLKKVGFNTECEYKDGNFSIEVKSSEIFDFLLKNIKDNALYSTVIDVIKENPDLYDVEFKGKEKGFIINLEPLSSTILDSKSFEANSNPNDAAIKKAEKLLEEEIIESNQVSYVVDYLVRGYSKLDADTKKLIKKINMTTIGITNVEAYEGIVKRNDVNLVSVIATSLIGFNPVTPGTVNVDLSDYNINAIIDDLDIIGKTFSFKKDNSINYITIGNIYITSSNHELLLSLILDLNGKEIKMDITLDASNIGTGYVINTTLTNVEIGSISLNEKEQKSLLEYLEKNVQSDLLKIKADTKAVVLDFDSYFNDSSLVVLSLAKDHLTKQIEVLDGKIQVRLTVSL